MLSFFYSSEKNRPNKSRILKLRSTQFNHLSSTRRGVSHIGIFGGYANVCWSSTHNLRVDQDAFLFSLVNKYKRPFTNKNYQLTILKKLIAQAISVIF